MRFANISRFFSPLNTLLKRYALAMVIFMLLRIFFIGYNFDLLNQASFSGFFSLLFGSVLFDWIFCWYALLPVFFISWIEYHKPSWNITRIAGRMYFTLIIFGFLILAFIDAFYYPFAKIRSGSELLTFTGNNNISPTIYMQEYWWAVMLILIISAVAFRIYPLQNPMVHKVKSWAFLLFIPLGLLLARGGLRLKPLHIKDAILFDNKGPWQVVPNAGLVFGQTFSLDIKDIFPVYTKHSKPDISDIQTVAQSNNHPNICLIIIESFGKEYTGFNRAGQPSYTPFLDALGKQSLVFNNFYANGLKSMDAIPAIYASIPSLLTKPFAVSAYSQNNTPSLPVMLKSCGYHTAFFHGADENSMGFRPFLMKAGLDEYFGLQQYTGKDDDIESNWGVYDEPFLQFAAKKMDAFSSPFMAGIFTLSSHHPYNLPEIFADSFKQISKPMHRSVRYTDMALKKFFDYAAGRPWFANTIFIITADHSSANLTSLYSSHVGRYTVPLLIYSPLNIKAGISEKTSCHADLLPTILQLSGCSQTFVSFGRSMLKNDETGKAVHYFEGVYNYIEGSYGIEASKDNVYSLFNISDGAIGKYHDLEANKAQPDSLHQHMLQYLSNYQYRLEHNDFSAR